MKEKEVNHFLILVAEATGGGGGGKESIFLYMAVTGPILQGPFALFLFSYRDKKNGVTAYMLLGRKTRINMVLMIPSFTGGAGKAFPFPPSPCSSQCPKTGVGKLWPSRCS